MADFLSEHSRDSHGGASSPDSQDDSSYGAGRSEDGSGRHGFGINKS